MTILVVFATNSGGTDSASQIVVDILSQAGHKVTRKTAKETNAEDFTAADCVILASPTWDYAEKEGQPHEDFIALMGKLEGKIFEGKRFAVLGLGDSSYTVFCGAVEHLDEFVKKMKGNLIVPSLKIDGFYYHPENPEKVKSWTQGLTKVLTT